MEETKDGYPIINPLLINHILDKILKHVVNVSDETTLKELRRVSRDWNVRLSPVIAASSHMVYFHNEAKLKSFVKVMRNCQSPIRTKFNFSGFQPKSNIFYEFLQVCGWLITSLRIDYEIRQFTINFKEKYLKEITLPKLKDFSYGDSAWTKTFKLKEELQTYKIFPAILNAAENIEELRFKFYEHDKFQNHSESPEQIVCRHNWKHLTDLYLNVKMKEELLVNLSQSSLRLTKLELQFHGGQSNSPGLTQFLASQSSSLLTLEIVEQSHGFTLKFPRMENLQIIRFNDAYALGERDCVRFDDFVYESELPKLREVKLSTVSGEDYWLPFFQTKSSTMESFHLPIISFINLDLACRLNYLFPNLSTLCVGLPSRQEYVAVLRTVFSTLTTLKTLNIYMVLREDLCADHILSGFEIEDCDRIRKNRLFLLPDFTETPTHPSLRNLTKLRRFEMTPQPPLDFLRENYPYFVSDMTGFLVFLRMESLKELKFINCGMTENCIQMLKDRFTVDVSPSYDYRSGDGENPIERVYTYGDYESVNSVSMWN